MIAFGRNFIFTLLVSTIVTYFIYLVKLENYWLSIPFAIGVAYLILRHIDRVFGKTMFLGKKGVESELPVRVEVLKEPSDKYLYKEYHYKEIRKPKFGSSGTDYLGILILLVTLLVSVIYVMTAIQNSFSSVKKAIQGGTLLFSLGMAIIYYLRFKSRFNSMSDKIGFFSGCAFGPPTAIEFLV